MDIRTPPEFAKLPKFLIADDGGSREFVVHCHYPRFIMEFDENGSGAPTWIDDPVFDPADGEPASQGARLMREAGEFFCDNGGIGSSIKLSKPCPNDTNGDGDCGMPACPHCGGSR